MKTCFKCGITKPRAEFYAHPRMADGLLGKCKECTKNDSRAAYWKDPERSRAIDRARSLEPARKAQIEASIRRQKELDPERFRRTSREWLMRNKEKRSAHGKVQRAVRNGTLTRQPCSVCGTDKRVEAHHPDYSKPLSVVWLCAGCHGLEHRIANERRRAG